MRESAASARDCITRERASPRRSNRRSGFAPKRGPARAAAGEAGASGSAHPAADDPTATGIVLGFDVGTRRIGVAIGNTLTRLARPLAIIGADADAHWPRIAALVDEWQPALLVVGVARHPDGTAHAMTARCERFARQLDGRYRLPVARIDERYSSAVVEPGRDDAAAAVILQQWLDAAAAPEREDRGDSRGGGADRDD
jgi:putative Holliday junction resolvase